MSAINLHSGAGAHVLRAEHVGYNWKSLRESRRALIAVSAEFKSGIVHFICGPSGAGKSTLGLLLGGLITPTEGRVLLDGKAISQQRERIAYATSDL